MRAAELSSMLLLSVLLPGAAALQLGQLRQRVQVRRAVAPAVATTPWLRHAPVAAISVEPPQELERRETELTRTSRRLLASAACRNPACGTLPEAQGSLPRGATVRTCGVRRRSVRRHCMNVRTMIVPWSAQA